MKRRLSVILFFLSIVLIIIGIQLDEFESVLEKAITVCLSCIGIG